MALLSNVCSCSCPGLQANGKQVIGNSDCSSLPGCSLGDSALLTGCCVCCLYLQFTVCFEVYCKQFSVLKSSSPGVQIVKSK